MRDRSQAERHCASVLRRQLLHEARVSESDTHMHACAYSRFAAHKVPMPRLWCRPVLLEKQPAADIRHAGDALTNALPTRLQIMCHVP
eukprot:scaffold4876_cov148-Isochrysis_galbana.AAC.2